MAVFESDHFLPQDPRSEAPVASLNPRQQEAVNDISGPFVLQGAGSAKPA